MQREPSKKRMGSNHFDSNGTSGKVFFKLFFLSVVGKEVPDILFSVFCMCKPFLY